MTAHTEMASPLRELTCDELDAVAGGASGYDTSLSTSIAMVAGAIGAMATAPVIAGALAAGSIVASGIAIYYAATDDKQQ